LALLGCDLDPKQDIIWFIGDTIADIECAVNAGCQPILYCDNIDKISKTIPEKMLTSDDFMDEFFNCRTSDYFLKKLPIIIGYNQLIKTTSLL
jgi:histidinol phosphatase-like enzyme